MEFYKFYSEFEVIINRTEIPVVKCKHWQNLHILKMGFNIIFWHFKSLYNPVYYGIVLSHCTHPKENFCTVFLFTSLHNASCACMLGNSSHCSIQLMPKYVHIWSCSSNRYNNILSLLNLGVGLLFFVMLDCFQKWCIGKCAQHFC